MFLIDKKISVDKLLTIRSITINSWTTAATALYIVGQ